jgi:hypothetical protein
MNLHRERNLQMYRDPSDRPDADRQAIRHEPRSQVVSNLLIISCFAAGWGLMAYQTGTFASLGIAVVVTGFLCILNPHGTYLFCTTALPGMLIGAVFGGLIN